MERSESDQAGPGREIARTTIERAMDEAPVGITLTDPSGPDNPLVYVNDSFVEMTGYERSEVLGRNCRFLQGPDTEDAPVERLREAIDAAEPVSVVLRNYRKNGAMFWNEVTVAPIRDDAGQVTHYIGFQQDVTARKEAELAVERERERLAPLVERINGLLGDVTADLVTASARDEVTRALTERIAATQPYVGAAVGTLDPGDERLDTDARAGDAPDLSIALDGDDPVAHAIETGDQQVVGTTDLPPDSPHRDGGTAVAAVPLPYRGTVSGALVVYAADVEAFDDREAVVLAALARAAATAIDAMESRRMLAADERVELDVDFSDPDVFLAGLSVGRELEYDGAVTLDDAARRAFVTVRGDDGDAFVADATAHPDVRAADLVVEREEGALVELVVQSSLLDLLADRGARLRDAAATDGEARLRVELPAGGDTRGLVDALGERFAESEVVGYREQDRPARTREAFVDALADDLTERQSTALRKAFLSGYFDPDRRLTGEELATSMGISRSSFHQHLRAAERKLISAVLEQR